MDDSLLSRVAEELKAHTTLDPVAAFNAARSWLREREEAGLPPQRDARQIATEYVEYKGLRWIETK